MNIIIQYNFARYT